MLRLPTILVGGYCLATAREVHSWSFGAVKTPRRPDASGWEQRVGTLECQRIFGPTREFECACGKYRGTSYRGMVCDTCGVKVTTTAERRSRFGHIDLPVPVAHPLGDESDLVDAVPVLPAVYFESSAGTGLMASYEGLVKATAQESRCELWPALSHLVEALLDVVTLAHHWNLTDASTLARGLVLERRDARDEDVPWS